MKAIYIIITILFAIIFASSCGKKSNEEAAVVKNENLDSNIVEITPEQYKTAEIQLGSIEEKALSGTTKVNGMLDVPPQNLVSISAPFGGFLKSTDMLQGLKVRKGQVVAMMQNPEYLQPQQDYIDFKSQLTYLKLEYDRQQELASENVNAEKTLQKSRAEYESMRARVLGLKTKLQLMNINISSLEKGNIQSTIPLYSPISGYVTQVNTNVGAFANATFVLFKIANTSHLHAELTVFEKDVPKIKIGQKVRFTLANETQERMATVYLVGKEISQERTVQIHCHLDKEDTNLLPGMYLSALVESGSNKIAAIPTKAIIEFEGSKFIFIAEDKTYKNGMSKYKLTPIKVGVSELNYTEIILNNQSNWKNWKVVINGSYDLLSKMKNNDEE